MSIQIHIEPKCSNCSYVYDRDNSCTCINNLIQSTIGNDKWKPKNKIYQNKVFDQINRIIILGKIEEFIKKEPVYTISLKVLEYINELKMEEANDLAELVNEPLNLS